MSFRPFARLAGLTFAGFILLGCGVTDTPNRTGQKWLEETGVTLPEPFTITVPIEVDSLGATEGESSLLAPGGVEQYAGSFAGLQADWRAVFRPADDANWLKKDSAGRARLSAEGDWALRLLIDTLARDPAKELKLRLRLYPDLAVGFTAEHAIDSLVRFGAITSTASDTIVTVAPGSKNVWLIQLPQSWVVKLRETRLDSNRVAVLALSSLAATDSGLARIVGDPFLQVQRATGSDTTSDTLLTALSIGRSARAYATRIVRPSIGKSIPVLYGGIRSRSLGVRIDREKLRQAIKAALPAPYRDDPRYSDPLGSAFVRYRVLGARLSVNVDSVVSEGGLAHPFMLTSRGDSLAPEGQSREALLEPGSSIPWFQDGSKDTAWTSSLVQAGSRLLVIIASEGVADTLLFEEGDESRISRTMLGRSLVLERIGGDKVLIHHQTFALGSASDPQNDTAQLFSEGSLVGPGRTSLDLQARNAFSRILANSTRPITIGLALDPYAFRSSISAPYDKNRAGMLLRTTFIRVRLADKPFGQAVLVLQPLGSKGRN